MVASVKKLFALGAVAVYVAQSSFVATDMAFGVSINESPDYPVVANLTTNNPICYIQQASGSTLDLSRLCSKNGTKTLLSLTDRKFLESYNNLLDAYQNQRTLVTPDTEQDPLSPIKVAQGVCSALNKQVPLDQIEKEQYQKITATEDRRNQDIAVIESDIINSLAVKFYCPQFAQRVVNGSK